MISQKKIAEYLNLGRSTVANILRNPEGTQKYNEETCKAVWEAAEKFGYKPNRASRSIRLGRSNLIGSVHFGSYSDLGLAMGQTLTAGVARRGYDLLTFDFSYHCGDFAKAVDQLVESRVEGVIISQMIGNFGAKEIAPLLRAGIKVIAVQGGDEWGVPLVYGDVRDAFQQMVQHLVEVGHRRLLLLVNSYNARPTRSRIAGFIDGIHSAGGCILPHFRSPDEVVQWPKSKGEVMGKVIQIEPYEAAMNTPYQYARSLIAAGALPDAIVCSNDRWAREVFTAVLQAGLRVPEDVALVGCDNDQFGNSDPYYLTSIEQNVAALCEKGLDLLIEQIKGAGEPEKVYSYPCPLVVRRSCGVTLAQTKKAGTQVNLDPGRVSRKRR